MMTEEVAMEHSCINPAACLVCLSKRRRTTVQYDEPSDRSVKDIWEGMDAMTKQAVYLLAGENTTIEEKMVIVSLLRTPALLSVVDNGQ